jgi:broad specificity phosphatase PhoE
MSRFFLLRHAQSVANQKGFLAGRMPDVYLSSKGKKEREHLKNRMIGSKFDLVLSSPMERCRQTIEHLLDDPKVNLKIEDGLTEVDYGVWTGKKFTTLMRNSEWRKIINSGSKIKFQDGESVRLVQKRAIETMRSYESKKNRNILVSTHADVVKFALFYALNTSLDNLDRLHVDNASVSIIDLEKGVFTVRAVNDRNSLIREYLV